jgi:site-specific recombinase XerD
MMHLPLMKDKKGEVLQPSNLLLHNNEGSMLFVDKNNKNRLVNFDLEAGKVVEEYHTTEETGDGVKCITNEFKNSQNTAA